MKKLFLLFFLFLTSWAQAQTLPSGWIGRVQNNTANQWATYSFNFTATVSGSQYIMFAFRQDPAYWYFDNAKLTVQGQTNNLLTNPDFATGGNLTVNTANYGQVNINAPTAWGVGYQSGIYPSAAGTWSGGQWIDGAVGSFDSIYQAVTLTAGTTYTITFSAMSNNTVDNNAVQLGVYAGQCSSLSMAPSNCSLPAGSGFESVATPSQTATTGCTNNCPQPPSSGPSWQVIRTNTSPVVISNIYPTTYNSPSNEGAANAFDGNNSTKYLNFDKKNAGVTVRLSQGRVVQKFTLTTANDFPGRDPTSYKLYGSNDGVNWTLIKQDTLTLSDTRFWTSSEIAVSNTTAYVYYFMLFPTTKAGDGCGQDCNSMQIAEITYYYDANDGITSTDQAAGSTPANPGMPGSVCSDCYFSEITTSQQALLDAARARRNAIGLGNRIDLYSDGSGNSVTIEQVGNYNRVQGLGGAGTNARVAGFGTAVDIKQGDTLSGRNLIELYVQGNGNNVTISQARNTTTGAVDGAESGGHISRVSITGDVGTYIFRQGNDGGTASGHFLNYTMSGSGGTHRVTQANNGEKLAFISITGNSNNETVLQSGTGNHFLDLTLTGNNNSANITQAGAGSHKATINLVNVGGPSAATLIQQGSTNQVYSITQQCANLSGCSVTVTQGTGP
jgi:hypothetical protein